MAEICLAESVDFESSSKSLLGKEDRCLSEPAFPVMGVVGVMDVGVYVSVVSRNSLSPGKA